MAASPASAHQMSKHPLQLRQPKLSLDIARRPLEDTAAPS